MQAIDLHSTENLEELFCLYDGDSNDQSSCNVSTIKPEPTEPHQKSEWEISAVEAPSSASLFGKVTISWCLRSSSSCPTFTVGHLNQLDQTNGILFSLSPNDPNLTLRLRLFEYNHTDSNPVYRPVEQCDKCMKRRSGVITSEAPLRTLDQNHYEMVVCINEQCAHRSENKYRSPSIRFFFVLEVIRWEEQVGGEMVLGQGLSQPILVVAPGKAINSKKRKTREPTIKGESDQCDIAAIPVPPVHPKKKVSYDKAITMILRKLIVNDAKKTKQIEYLMGEVARLGGKVPTFTTMNDITDETLLMASLFDVQDMGSLLDDLNNNNA